VAIAAARLADAVRPAVIEWKDLIIAATAKTHGLTILTGNLRHFAPTGVPRSIRSGRCRRTCERRLGRLDRRVKPGDDKAWGQRSRVAFCITPASSGVQAKMALPFVSPSPAR
jgi:hypothetical protein